MNYTLYSQRLDAYKKHDGWIYDRFPATFRTQLVYIVRDLPVKEPFWQRFNQWFEREKGWTPKIYFIQESSHPQREKLEYRLEQLDDFEFLDLIEGSFIKSPRRWNPRTGTMPCRNSTAGSNSTALAISFLKAIFSAKDNGFFSS